MSRKLIVAVVIAVLAFGASMAMATESRVETLGDQELYLMDDTNIFSNPATAAWYPKMARLHMGGNDYLSYDGEEADDYAYGGGTMQMMDMLVIGAFFARNPEYEYSQGMGTIFADVIDTGTGLLRTQDFGPDRLAVAGQNDLIKWENPFDIMVAVKSGDMAFGISYYLANGAILEKYDGDVEGTLATDTETYKAAAALQSLKLGASMNMDTVKPEFWIRFDPFRIDTEDEHFNDQVHKEYLKGRMVGAGARFFYNMSDNLAIVPAIRLENSTAKVKRDTEVTAPVDLRWMNNLDQEYTFNSLEFGASVQYTADNLFLIGSAGIRGSNYRKELRDENKVPSPNPKHDDTEQTGYFYAPVVAMGLEYMAKEWLTLRGGINTTTFWASEANSDEEVDLHQYHADQTTIETMQETSASLGMGLHLGNLTIDTTLGNYILVGEEGGTLGEGPNLFSSLDAKYVF